VRPFGTIPAGAPFLGAKRFGGQAQSGKRVLILDVERYRYQRFISDLAGMDIHGHGGDAVKRHRLPCISSCGHHSCP
jgi:hypothetical protein